MENCKSCASFEERLSHIEKYLSNRGIDMKFGIRYSNKDKREAVWDNFIEHPLTNSNTSKLIRYFFENLDKTITRKKLRKFLDNSGISYRNVSDLFIDWKNSNFGFLLKYIEIKGRGENTTYKCILGPEKGYEQLSLFELQED